MAQFSKALITLISQHNYWLIELLHPHVPFQLRGGLALRELSPQPLPPKAIATFAGHAMGRRLANLALDVNAQGGDGFSVLAKEIDDWCGTGPKILKWPKGWPFPPPEPEPHPEWGLGSGGPPPLPLLDFGLASGGPPPTPLLNRQILFGGAIALLQVAAGFPEGEMQEGFAKQADILMEKGMSLEG
jgi:hypothetical protein